MAFSNFKTRRSTSHARWGAAAVEFAVVSPLLFLLLAGIMEFGQAFRIQHALTTATRRAARVAVVSGGSNSVIIQKTRQNCADILGVKGSDVLVDIYVNGVKNGDLTQSAKGAEVKVTVQIPYSKCAVGFFSQMFANTNLKSSCIFERE
jgi:Flp pilus assembly protein TadG